jgi:hypothetical protein
MARDAKDFAIAAAVNNHEILEACLKRSPDLVSGALQLKIYENYPSAALALNAALDGAEAPIAILAHQDVYLPAGWLDRLARQIDLVEQKSPNWAVVGLYGREPDGAEVGLVWSSGLGRVLGHPGFEPTEVVTLDELVLIVRKDSGLRFDEGVPGFHFYGTDIVMQGRVNGAPSFVVEAPAIHNGRPVKSLSGAYAVGYRYMQRKWRRHLPLKNLSSDIVWHPVKLWRAQWAGVRRYRNNVNRPRPDAVEVAKRLNYE